MKIAVRYQSRGGNTKAVAEVIANAVGVKAETIDTPIDEAVDILFVGGVYAWTIDKSLTAFLEQLNADTVKSIAAFTTGGAMGATGKISEIAQEKGITVSKKDLPFKMGAKNYHLFGGEGSVTLSAKQISLIEAFVSEVVR